MKPPSEILTWMEDRLLVDHTKESNFVLLLKKGSIIKFFQGHCGNLKVF